MAAPSLAPFRPLVRCLYTVRPLSLPSAQACATGEKLKCAQPQPQEADPLQVRNPSHSCHLSIYLHPPIYLSSYLSTWLFIHRTI